MIIGDFNATRLGNVVRELRAELPDCEDYCCPNIPDPVERANDNAYSLATMCMDIK